MPQQPNRQFFDFSSYTGLEGYSKAQCSGFEGFPECVPYVGGWVDTPEITYVSSRGTHYSVEYRYSVEGYEYIQEHYDGVEGYLKELERQDFMISDNPEILGSALIFNCGKSLAADFSEMMHVKIYIDSPDFGEPTLSITVTASRYPEKEGIRYAIEP